MSLRILFLTTDRRRLDLYRPVFDRHQCAVDCVSSFDGALKASVEIPHNGVIYDEEFNGALTGSQRELMKNLFNKFPFLRVHPSGPAHWVPKERESISFFLYKACTAFPARTLRSHARIPSAFNVELSLDLTYVPGRTERTVTLNVSEQGCFILYCNEWKYHHRIWFKIRELANPAPVCAEIRWSHPWGATMRHPGLGVKFTAIAEDQLQELLNLAHSSNAAA